MAVIFQDLPKFDFWRILSQRTFTANVLVIAAQQDCYPVLYPVLRLDEFRLLQRSELLDRSAALPAQTSFQST